MKTEIQENMIDSAISEAMSLCARNYKSYGVNFDLSKLKINRIVVETLICAYDDFDDVVLEIASGIDNYRNFGEDLNFSLESLLPFCKVADVIKDEKLIL